MTVGKRRFVSLMLPDQKKYPWRSLCVEEKEALPAAARRPIVPYVHGIFRRSSIPSAGVVGPTAAARRRRCWTRQCGRGRRGGRRRLQCACVPRGVHRGVVQGPEEETGQQQMPDVHEEAAWSAGAGGATRDRA